MSIFRSIVAVVAGIAMMSLVVQVLEFVLVNAAAGRTLVTMGDYFAVRNMPSILAAKIVYTVLAGVLGGYTTARIGRGQEMTNAALAAALETAVLVWDYTAGEYAWGTPVWMRVTLVVLSGPAMLAGAAIRAKAAAFEPLVEHNGRERT